LVLKKGVSLEAGNKIAQTTPSEKKGGNYFRVTQKYATSNKVIEGKERSS